MIQYILNPQEVMIMKITHSKILVSLKLVAAILPIIYKT